MSIWDDPEIAVNDDYVTFDAPGDTVTGRILAIRKQRFDDGKVVPSLLLDTADGEKTLTAGQIRLKIALSEQRPEPGDTITVTLTGVEKRAGGKTLKLFDVRIVRGTGQGPAPDFAQQAAMASHPSMAAAPAAPALAVVPPPAAAPVSLTPEQVQALQAMGIQVPGA